MIKMYRYFFIYTIKYKVNKRLYTKKKSKILKFFCCLDILLWIFLLYFIHLKLLKAYCELKLDLKYQILLLDIQGIGFNSIMINIIVFICQTKFNITYFLLYSF